jgi:hypothetical protein
MELFGGGRNGEPANGRRTQGWGVISEGGAWTLENEPSGVTSKPAIEGHFKTGQRNIILDEPVLPYRMAVWQPQSDPILPLSSDHQPGILQNPIPVFSSFCRELSFES